MKKTENGNAFLGDYDMTEIQWKQNEIEKKIDAWEKEGLIKNVSKHPFLPDGSTQKIRIQHSVNPFTVFFNGQACKIRLEDSNERPLRVTWSQDDVVEKVLEHIYQLLKS